MPIYDFQCTSCNYEDEVLRKISAANIDTCPKCNEVAFTKKVSAPGFRLSGTGWYETDFKDGNKLTAAVEKPDAPSEKAADSKVSESTKLTN